jgi:hypothetical protein
VGVIEGLDKVENRKILHCRESKPGHPGPDSEILTTWTKVLLEELTVAQMSRNSMDFREPPILIPVFTPVRHFSAS